MVVNSEGIGLIKLLSDSFFQAPAFELAVASQKASIAYFTAKQEYKRFKLVLVLKRVVYV